MPVRAAARGARAGQAAVLRHGDAVCAAPAIGLLVESHEGPADEDRRQPRSPVEPRRDRPLRAGRRSSASTIPIARRRSPTSARSGRSSAFVAAMRSVLAAQQSKKGAGIRILTETVASPTLAAQIDEHPDAPSRRRSGCSGSRSAATTPARAAASRSASTSTRSTRSRRPTSSCRSTPTSCAPAPSALRHARAFASRRRVEGDRARRNRLYAVESTPTNTRHAAPITGCRCKRVGDRGVRARAGRAARRAPASRPAPLPQARRALARAARQGSAGRARHAAWSSPATAQPAVGARRSPTR